MTGKLQGKLFLCELTMLLRSRLNWLLGALLFAALCWGAHNGARHADEQRATLARIAAHIEDKVRADLAAVERHARTQGPRLAYWQDPSDVAGYMRYGLHAYAVKQPWPLAGIATGQSRLQPFYLRAELDFVAPPSASFDYVNPRFLGLGEFDLAFVLVYVLPLVLIAVGAARLAGERDSGALTLMTAQATSLRRLVLFKAAAMAAVCVPYVLAAAGLAMLLAGLPLASVGEQLAPPGAALAGYTAVWVLMITAVGARTRVVASYLVLLSLWIASVFVLPASLGLLAGVATRTEPGVSALSYLDELRRVNTVTPQQRDAQFLAYLAEHPAYAAAAERIGQVPYATKMIALQLGAERRMAERFGAAQQRRAAAAARIQALHWLSPAMVLEASLQQAAGSGAARHQEFVRQAARYTDTLRGFFWPRALAEAARPADRCPGCAARLNFTEHARIPRFRPDQHSGAAPDWRAAAWLWLLAALLALGLWWRPGVDR